MATSQPNNNIFMTTKTTLKKTSIEGKREKIIKMSKRAKKEE